MNQRNFLLPLAGIAILCSPALATTAREVKPALFSSTSRTLVLLGASILVMGWGLLRKKRHHHRDVS